MPLEAGARLRLAFCVDPGAIMPAMRYWEIIQKAFIARSSSGLSIFYDNSQMGLQLDGNGAATS